MANRATGTVTALPTRRAPAADWSSTPQGLAAVRAAELGFRIHPLVENGKKPALQGWRGIASDDPTAVAQMWSERPTANVGAVMTGLVVIDTDTPEAEAVIAELDLPPCPTVRTRRGYHRYFTGSHWSSPTTVPGLEVWSGSDRNSVMPGSVVKEHTYEWAEGLAPWEVPMLPLPAALKLVLKKRVQEKRTVTTGKPIAEGDRNNALTSIAGTWRAADVPPACIPAALAVYNAERCDPPLPAGEVEAIARSSEDWPAPPPWNRSGPDRRAFLRDSRLSPRDRLVLGALTTYVDPEGVADPGPSIDTLATDTGYDRKTVSAALRDLADVGRIERVTRPRQATRYCILPTSLAA